MFAGRMVLTEGGGIGTYTLLNRWYLALHVFGNGLDYDRLFYDQCKLWPAWISNCIHYNIWDEIIYPFKNINGATVEV